MAIEKTEAIIIKKTDFRETSAIITFYTREFGKIKGLLKGARADKEKFGSSLVTFTNNEIVFYRKTKGEIHLVTQCDLKNDFSNLHRDLNKINLSCYIARLTDAVMPSEDKNEAVFDLLLNFFKTISIHDDLSHLEKIFEIKLLALSGFKPYLDACIACSKKIENNARFSLKSGGLICSDCFCEDESANKISEGTIASLLHLERNSWEQSLRLKLSKTLDQELGLMLKKYLSYHIGIRDERDLASAARSQS